MSNMIINGIMGLCVADALGVPVEFEDRKNLKKNPVIDIRSFGTYNQVAGTWSDDTSMTLCLLESLSKGLNYYDIMKNFLKWINNGEFTPHGEVFDVGMGTRKVLMNYNIEKDPLCCGGNSELDNGNGSLMRILPIVFYLMSKYGVNITENEEAMEIIHNISRLTHAHNRSLIACGIYCSIAMCIIKKMNIKIAVDNGINNAIEFYKMHNEFNKDLQFYDRICKKNFSKIHEEQINSSGYVVDTLEAAVWCLLNTSNYKDCVLKAVNLGEDTDTVAAVAGGLAGLYYGYDSIPLEWINVIAKKDYIENLCNQMLI